MNEQNESTPSGVVVVITCRGVEMATASAFYDMRSERKPDWGQVEAQARRVACVRLIDACCHEDIAKVMTSHDCDRIAHDLVRKHDWNIHYICVGDAERDE